jgi:hypothetical protein
LEKKRKKKHVKPKKKENIKKKYERKNEKKKTCDVGKATVLSPHLLEYC